MTKSPRRLTPRKRNSLPNGSKYTSASRANIFIRIKYFHPHEVPDDYRFDVGNEYELVEGVDPQTLIKLVKSHFLRKPGR